MKQPLVSIVMGSDSDLGIMQEGAGILKTFGVPHEIRVLSAHRSPNLMTRYVRQSEKNGVKVFIAGAGAAAALPGAIAALTTRPVLGVPIASSHLQGLDSLLAIAQLPAGVPAATLAIGSAGSRNAALLAAQILALGNTRLAAKLKKFKADQEAAIGRKDSRTRAAQAGN